MSNPYYTFTPTLTPGTRARSDAVNLQFQHIETAFDNLPTSADAITRGISSLGIEVQGSTTNVFEVGMDDPRVTNQEGDLVVFKATHTNNGASTLNVDGIGAVPLVAFDGTPMGAGGLTSGRYYEVRYDATNTRFMKLVSDGQSFGLDYLTDVIIGSPVVGDVLTYNGTYWVPASTSFNIVKDEGVTLVNGPHTILNFVGAGVTATNGGGGIATVTIPAVGNTFVVKDEGSTVAGGPHSTVDFVGAGVTVTNGGGGTATVTVPAGNVEVRTYTSNDTWSKPAGAKLVEVTCIGEGGGGGGGGSRDAGQTTRGGGGGAGGCTSFIRLLPGDLTSTVAVTVGTGGVGGIARSGTAGSGGNGADGIASTFGSYCQAAGGPAGGGGNGGAGGGGGSYSQPSYNYLTHRGRDGATSVATGTGTVTVTPADPWAFSTSPTSPYPDIGCGAGGGGGGITNLENVVNGGDASGTDSVVGPAASFVGLGGTSPTDGGNWRGTMGFGGGGGGGTRQGSGAGTDGGDGGFPGGGGGGGSAARSGNTTGAGGNGGGGVVVVVTYF